MNRYAMGDNHGRFQEYKLLLEKVNFNYDEDEFIQTGDIVDYGPGSFEIIFDMLKMKKRISVKGNHDEHFLSYIINPEYGHPFNGEHGSYASMLQWQTLLSNEKELVKTFLESQKLYHIDSKNNLFVHAGLDTDLRIEEQDKWILMDERYFWEEKMMGLQGKIEKIETFENFNEIFIGHTPTFCHKKNASGLYVPEPTWVGVELEPIHIANVWNLDTGAKMKPGRLSIINIDTHEVTQQELIY